MTTLSDDKLVYFVSGMWCTTCAKTIREGVEKLQGVQAAQINYASKLLLVELDQGQKPDDLDSSIRERIERSGFAARRQTSGWLQDFHQKLEAEARQKLSWVRVSLVWFLAMWSSMIAFTGYVGGSLSPEESFYLALASSAFGLPAILIGIYPYGQAGLRALWFSHLPTLDLFIFLGGLSATGVSLHSLLHRGSLTYADSGAMIVALLLLTKKIENSVIKKVSSAILFQIHSKETEVLVLKKGLWQKAREDQIRKGDRVRFATGETLSFDGLLESDKAQLNRHLLSGEGNPIELKTGDHLLAGSIALTPLEMSVLYPQGQRKIDAWAEAALLSGNQKSDYTRLFAKIESTLTLSAFLGALFIAGLHFARGGDAASTIEAFFIGILIFCPCLFASIIPLSRQMAHLALLSRGINVSRNEALLELARARFFYFDKTGTLEAVESGFETWEKSEFSLSLLRELAQKSSHPILRGLGAGPAGEQLVQVREYPGQGVIGITDQGLRLCVGRASFIQEQKIPLPSQADSHFPLVAYDEKVVGQIFIKSSYDEKAKVFLQGLLLLEPRAQVQILSGDPDPQAGERLSQLDPRLSYRGNLSPDEKAGLIHKGGVFIGDGLNDTLALAKADVSFRLGHRVLGFAPVDFQLQLPNLDLILICLLYARKYRRVLLQTAAAAVVYNIVAISLAAAGKFTPLGAVLAMLLSFSLLLLSSLRLLQIPGGSK